MLLEKIWAKQKNLLFMFQTINILLSMRDKYKRHAGVCGNAVTFMDDDFENSWVANETCIVANHLEDAYNRTLLTL